MGFLMAVATATEGTPWALGSGQLLTWTGVIAVVLALLLLGILVPRSSHLREIRILKEGYETTIAAYVSQIADKNAEILVLRSVGDVRQASEAELLAQHRLTIEAVRSINYSIDQMRSGMERAQGAEATP